MSINFSQIKDYVREHFGRVGIPTSFLDLALLMGRREIEKTNFWWMEKEHHFSPVANQQSYEIKSGLINLPNFKDMRWLFWKDNGDNQWEPLPFGQKQKQELDMEYESDDTGEPEQAVIHDDELWLYPIPDASNAYIVKLYHYEFTENPSNLVSDDLINSHPMALVYSALAQGYETELKDLQSASYWRKLLQMEIASLKREHMKRSWMDKILFEPHTGPWSTRMSMSNMQIYPKR